MIWDTKRASFDIVPSRSVFPKSSTILDLVKSLLYKVCSLTRVLFDTEAHNCLWDEDLKKMDGEALTLGDVQTFYFLAACFLVVAFFAWAKSWDEFLVKGGGDCRDLNEDMDPLFFDSFQF